MNLGKNLHKIYFAIIFVFTLTLDTYLMIKFNWNYGQMFVLIFVLGFILFLFSGIIRWRNLTPEEKEEELLKIWAMH